MGKKWMIHFNYKIQIEAKDDQWVTIRKGDILAKDGNSALKEIRKRLNNVVFERIIIDAGKSANG